MKILILEGGKYEVIFDKGKLTALRWGEPWRDLTGDNLVLSMVQEIARLKTDLAALAIQVQRKP